MGFDHKNEMRTKSEDNNNSAKWALLLGDRLFPMPRREMRARDILDQTGTSKEFVLQRDHASPNDITFEDHDRVDLAEGNVFRAIPREEVAPRPGCTEPPKLAFVADDHWEVTLNPRQTGHSLKRLLGLPENAEVLHDLESPNDQLIKNDEIVLFGDGPVFTVKHVSITVTVNEKPVHFNRRRVTGLEIKETAKSQGVKIELDFVLNRLKPDGGLGPAIANDEKVTLKHGDAFQCVGPDDNS